MPHVDTLSLRTPLSTRGDSRFARPVAAITAFVRRLARRAALAHDPVTPRIRQDLDVRELEERFAHAHDHGDLERMERDFNRRDGGGLPMGDWR